MSRLLSSWSGRRRADRRAESDSRLPTLELISCPSRWIGSDFTLDFPERRRQLAAASSALALDRRHDDCENSIAAEPRESYRLAGAGSRRAVRHHLEQLITDRMAQRCH
jgi:hypothetical protein